jgi:hypothetical protein
MLVVGISHSDDQVVVRCCSVHVQMFSELGWQVFDVLPYF